MSIKKLGEFGLIEEIKKRFSTFNSDTTQGIGDDCAIIPKNDEISYVITTDMLVEGKHFILDNISSFELGHKSLAVNISDVASMGATPYCSFLSFALSNEVDEQWCRGFIDGYYSLSHQYNIPLLGGDTTSANDGALTISVTAIGEVKNSNIKLRSMAKVGDIIAVTSNLGDSALALKLMLGGEECPDDLRNFHNKPNPHIKQGEWLGAQSAVNAMMDISDGVASDITHICKLSECGAKINTSVIPHSERLKEICENRQLNILDFSLAGGEDYSLLLTVSPSKFEGLKQEFDNLFKENITAIGEITESGISYINSSGKVVEQKLGFRHF